MNQKPDLSVMEGMARNRGRCSTEFEGHEISCESHDGIEVLWRWDREVVSYAKVLERLRAE